MWLRLCRILPYNKNYKIDFENFYTTLYIIVNLAQISVLSLGTVSRTRIPNCKLPTRRNNHEAQPLKMWYILTASNWFLFSGRIVSALPFVLFAEKDSESILSRFDQKLKRTISIFCPHIVREYNKHIEGVKF